VDAVHSYEPIVSQAESQGYHTIFSSAETPGLMPNVLAFSAAVMHNRPEDVKAFVAAWMEAQAYWQANPAAGDKIIADATGQKPEDISLKGIALRTLKDNQNAFKPGYDTTSIYYSAQLNLNFLIQSGNITKAPNTQVILDPSFLK
jgi:NitT/TauT family transport system substrate-binding protein